MREPPALRIVTPDPGIHHFSQRWIAGQSGMMDVC